MKNAGKKFMIYVSAMMMAFVMLFGSAAGVEAKSKSCKHESYTYPKINKTYHKKKCKECGKILSSKSKHTYGKYEAYAPGYCVADCTKSGCHAGKNNWHTWGKGNYRFTHKDKKGKYAQCPLCKAKKYK